MYCPRIRGSGRKAVTLSFRSWLCLKSMHKYGLNILNNRGTKPYESLFLTRPTHYLCSCTDIFLLLFTSNIFIKECICAVFSNSEVLYRSISLYLLQFASHEHLFCPIPDTTQIWIHWTRWHLSDCIQGFIFYFKRHRSRSWQINIYMSEYLKTSLAELNKRGQYLTAFFWRAN